MAATNTWILKQFIIAEVYIYGVSHRPHEFRTQSVCVGDLETSEDWPTLQQSSALISVVVQVLLMYVHFDALGQLRFTTKSLDLPPSLRSLNLSLLGKRDD